MAIGDVEGHDIDAATTMGRLRSALQSYALEGHGPAALVGWLEQALTALALPRLASVCVGLLERPTADAPGRLQRLLPEQTFMGWLLADRQLSAIF